MTADALLTALAKAKEEAEARARELAIINRFAQAIGSTLDLDAILQTICREMVSIFEARNTGIGLLSPEGQALTLVAFHAASPQESDVTGLTIPLAGYPATQYVIRTGRPIVVPDVQHNPLTASFHAVLSARGTTCLMIVPLMARGEVIGTIGIPTSDPVRIFTPQEVSLAQTIAGQIAGAIANARLHAASERARQVAERDLEIGRQIQTGFFPETLPRAPGWEIGAFFRPARQVSGDFYDAFPLAGGSLLALVVADVCDKGVGAALFMVLFRSLIRAFSAQAFAETGPANRAQALEWAVAQTNDYIAGTHGRQNMFATLFAGILEPAAGRLLYVDAGLGSSVVFGPGGRQRRLPTTGPALGLFAGLPMQVGAAALTEGEGLFVFTDGAVEAVDGQGHMLGEARLLAGLHQAAASGGEVAQRLGAAVSAHMGAAEPFDDVTMLVAQRLSRSGIP
ncbi:MAG: SpoIIE family protein phosphatase [Thermodesulfobacteriota bacterium]